MLGIGVQGELGNEVGKNTGYALVTSFSRFLAHIFITVYGLIENMSHELREFVYLDSMSVNSLLASQHMAIPETIRDVSESVSGEIDSGSVGGSVGFQGIGKFSAELAREDTDESRQLAETERRINDQYKFSILHAALEEEEELIDLNEAESDDDTSISYDQGDVIKATGDTVTDPFYRVLSSISSLLRISKVLQIESDEEMGDDFDDMTDEEGEWIFDTWKDILHGENIGLRIDSDDYRYPVLMTVKTDELWVTPEQEFTGGRNFTVVGRVSKILTGNNKWDFVDLLQIMGNTFTDDSIEQFREAFSEVGENMDDVEEDGFEIDAEMSREDYVVEEPAIIVEPVALYW